VAAVGCWNFLRAGHWPGRRFWPVYVLAVPAAFLGGGWAVPGPWLQRLVGLVLLASAWRLGRKTQDPTILRAPNAMVLPAGALGSRLGSRHWPVTWIRRCLAGVLVLAGLKLLGLRLG